MWHNWTNSWFKFFTIRIISESTSSSDGWKCIFETILIDAVCQQKWQSFFLQIIPKLYNGVYGQNPSFFTSRCNSMIILFYNSPSFDPIYFLFPHFHMIGVLRHSCSKLLPVCYWSAVKTIEQFINLTNKLCSKCSFRGEMFSDCKQTNLQLQNGLVPVQQV